MARTLYFYGKDPEVERAFGRMESQTAPLFADAIERLRLPEPGSRDHELLIFYLGLQHSRTMSAAEQHNEGAVKALTAILRRKADFEGNDAILKALDRVVIRRVNAVSEVVGYATVGANLLADLKFVLLCNDSPIPFISSDAPVVLHNRLYEGQHINVIGYANVGLQLFLPLGPRLVLFGYDAAVYEVPCVDDRLVRVADAQAVRLINDLQWESAHAVLLTTRDTPDEELSARGAYWRAARKAERVEFCEELVEISETEARTRQGSGQSPSVVSLDLSFITPRLPKPPRLRLFEIPPFPDPRRVERTDRPFALLDEFEETRCAS